MAEPWKPSQLKLLKEYPAKGPKWVVEAINSVPGAPKRTHRAILKRARELGYHWKPEPLRTNDQIDAAIRRAYQSGEKGAAGKCAKACNRPRWWIVARAKELELRPMRGRFINSREDACIRANAHLPLGEIQAKLLRQGFRRSTGTIHVYMKRRMILSDLDRPLSVTALSELFGVSDRTLTKHIAAGRLIARRSGEGGSGQPTQYLMEPIEIARFVIKYPQMIDLRKVDPIWFITMLAEHAAAASRDMHRNQGARLAQMVRENPDISPELVADMLGIGEAEASKRLAEARRETMREAA